MILAINANISASFKNEGSCSSENRGLQTADLRLFLRASDSNMPAPVTDTIVLGGINTFEAHAVDVPSHNAFNEKIRLSSAENRDSKDGAQVDESEIKAAPQYGGDAHEKDNGSEDVIIVTGTDAAQHLLPMRDDGDSALTFRSLFLATILSAFQAVMTQIYNVSERFTRLGVN